MRSALLDNIIVEYEVDLPFASDDVLYAVNLKYDETTYLRYSTFIYRCIRFILFMLFRCKRALDSLKSLYEDKKEDKEAKCSQMPTSLNKNVANVLLGIQSPQINDFKLDKQKVKELKESQCNAVEKVFQLPLSLIEVSVHVFLLVYILTFSKSYCIGTTWNR